MKEQLKRDLNKTYLILCDEEKQYKESYELEMLTKNALHTLLPLQVFHMDTEIRLLYDISAKQSLKDCAERVKLSSETLRRLFEAVDRVIGEVREYLLDAESVMLDLGHIYTKENRMYFCYCPWEKQELPTAFRKMLEEILGNLDYRDTEGVELAYHLYQKVCKGEFEIAEILKAHMPVKPFVSEPEVCEESFLEPASMKDADLPEYKVPEQETSKVKKKGKIMGKILKFFLKKQTEESAEQSVSRERRSYEEKAGVFQFPENIEGFEKHETADGNTTLLKNMPVGMWRLRPLLPGYEEFCITGENFLVGKKKDAVDGYIGRNSISRIHSHLYVREGRLFIADANSTNGTFVNNIALEPGREAEIFQGDCILFADVGYECYNNL